MGRNEWFGVRVQRLSTARPVQVGTVEYRNLPAVGRKRRCAVFAGCLVVISLMTPPAWGQFVWDGSCADPEGDWHTCCDFGPLKDNNWDVPPDVQCPPLPGPNDDVALGGATVRLFQQGEIIKSLTSTGHFRCFKPLNVAESAILSMLTMASAGDLERACVEDNDCNFGTNGPCAEHPDVGSIWWVQAPQEEPLGCLPGPCGRTDQFARVDASPHFQVWELTTLHVGDCEIVPVATYQIRACNPPDTADCGDSLMIGTVRQSLVAPTFRGNFGDVAGAVLGTEFSPPDGFTNVNDISAYVLTRQNYGTANTPQAHPTWVDLHGLGTAPPPNGNPPQYILNISDLTLIVKALQGNKWTDGPREPQPRKLPVSLAQHGGARVIGGNRVIVDNVIA